MLGGIVANGYTDPKTSGDKKFSAGGTMRAQKGGRYPKKWLTIDTQGARLKQRHYLSISNERVRLNKAATDDPANFASRMATRGMTARRSPEAQTTNRFSVV